MNHRFLREEAARFRVMADEADREASRVRLLALATKYEEMAKAAGSSAQPEIVEPGAARPETAEAAPDESNGEARAPVAPSPAKTTKLRLDRQSTRDTKETIVVERRPSIRRV